MRVSVLKIRIRRKTFVSFKTVTLLLPNQILNYHVPLVLLGKLFRALLIKPEHGKMLHN